MATCPECGLTIDECNKLALARIKDRRAQRLAAMRKAAADNPADKGIAIALSSLERLTKRLNGE